MKKIFYQLVYPSILVFASLTIIILTAQAVLAPQTKIVTDNNQLTLPVEKIIELEIPDTVTTTLMFGGDVMLSRTVNRKSRSYNDYTWPMSQIASTTALADLFIINLESPFTIGGNYNIPTGSFSFNADPRSMEALLISGVNVVSLANNHTINQGKKGIEDTIKLLTENKIAFTGAGLNEAQARQPAIVEKNNLTFGFLGYAYPNDYSVATEKRNGIANMDIEKMIADVTKLKVEVDVVIVMMHAGHEYVNRPNQQQITFAKSAIDAGADIIVGHHPHWVQNIEIYNNKPILYSLGNLVFDQMWSKETQEGAMAEIVFIDQEINSIKILPTIIKDYGQVELADKIISERVLKRMGLEVSEIKLRN
jgi:poly-gamma-glutamate capsule biosynthesis protein CapA/YwtB (metallophosphatase superfamily)